MEEKIAALLRKAEGTDNPHEAEAYSKKAAELMIKLGIEEAVIRAKMGELPAGAKIVQMTLDFYGSYAQAQMLMGSAIGTGIGLKTMVGKTYGANAKGKYMNGSRLYMVGFEKDVERTIILIESLQLQCASASTSWWKNDMGDQPSWMTAMEKFKARRQFIASFGQVVGGRLRDQRQEAVVESTGTDLVLVNQSKKIDDWVADKYGQLKTSTSRMSGSAAGRNGGSAAGRAANLGGSQVGSGRKVLS